MTKPNKAAIAFVLDRSGSMQSVKDATIEGFNGFLREQKTLPGEATFSLTLFDRPVWGGIVLGAATPAFAVGGVERDWKHGIEAIYVDRPIDQIPELTPATYQPRGSTPLYDAVGFTIETLGERLAAMPEEERPSRVIVVIQTDGQENASDLFTAERVKEMIRHQQEVYNWVFLFMGADQDAWVAGGAMGIAKVNTLSYDAVNTASALCVASNTAALYRGSPTYDAGFTTTDARKGKKK